MKMTEFLKLSDDDKCAEMEKQPANMHITEDKGICAQCGGEAETGDYCFGCGVLICEGCVEKEPHMSECFRKPFGARHEP
jgi:hypothetical protein